jgi:tripartite-type tricarboxylate transporter receptor subunit TctC
MTGRRGAMLGLLSGVALARGNATAQGRSATIVVGFPPGTVSDLTTRFLAERLAARLGHPVQVENRPGADGGIGAAAVARARPDGTTLLYATNSSHGANPSLYRSLAYDPVADFAAIHGIARQATVIVARTDAPFRTIAALVEASRAAPGGLTWGHGNTSTHVVGAMLATRTGLRAERVPFRGNPQSLTELVAGRLDFAVADLFTGMEQVKAGALRALAVSGAARSALAPEVPSLVELGVFETEIVAWGGLFAPAGTPEPVILRLAATVREILSEPGMQALLARTGAEVFPLGPEELAAHVPAEIARWARYIATAGIEKQ